MGDDLDEQLLIIMKEDEENNGGDTGKDALKLQAECAVEEDKSCGEDTDNVDHDSSYDDPLGEELASKEAVNQFNWLFDDNELLQDQESVAENINTTSNGKRGKRARLINEQKSKNGKIVWTTTSTEEDKLFGMPEHEAIGRGPASNVSNVLESFLLLFDTPILQEIIIHTNEEIRTRRHGKKGETSGNVDLYEMRAWLGLNYLCGVFRNAARNGPLQELWSPELGNAIFRATMPYTRFVFIAEHLSLAESSNNLQLIRNVWNRFIINCRSYYAPSSWCSIDDHFLCTHSEPKSNKECSQSGRKTLSLLTLCDAKTLYISKADIVIDDDNYDDDDDDDGDDDHDDEKSKSEIVCQLVCDIKTTERNIALSNSYAKFDLAKNLLNRKLSSTGMLAKTSMDLPKNSNELTLYSDASKITTHNDGILLSCGLSSKLDASKVHKLSMQANKLMKDLSNSFTTSNATPPSLASNKTLSLKLLHTILNIAGFNAGILFRLSPKGNAYIDHRDYLRQLGLFLTQQRLERRLLRTSATPLIHKLNICEILGVPMTNILAEAAEKAQQSKRIGLLHSDNSELPRGIPLSSRHADKVRRCRPCTQMKRQTKSRTRCQQCLATRCHSHLIARCFECTGITLEQAEQLTTKIDYYKID